MGPRKMLSIISSIALLSSIIVAIVSIVYEETCSLPSQDSSVVEIDEASGSVPSQWFSGTITLSSGDLTPVVEVSPIFVKPRRPRSVTFSESHDHILELRASSGRILRCIPFSVGEIVYSNGNSSVESGAGPLFGFGFRIQDPPDYASFAILSEGVKLLAVDLSDNAPTVAISGISENQLFSEGETVDFSWVGSDKDGDSLLYRLHHSFDGGESYGTLFHSDIDETSYSVSTDRFRNIDTARIGISVSDGTRSTFSETPIFRTKSNRGPSVSLQINSGGYFRDEDFTLEAFASTDKDGGVIDLIWSSDIDGYLGAGQIIMLSTDDLTEGAHVFAVTATDSLGRSSTTSATISISH